MDDTWKRERGRERERENNFEKNHMVELIIQTQTSVYPIDKSFV